MCKIQQHLVVEAPESENLIRTLDVWKMMFIKICGCFQVAFCMILASLLQLHLPSLLFNLLRSGSHVVGSNTHVQKCNAKKKFMLLHKKIYTYKFKEISICFYQVFFLCFHTVSHRLQNISWHDGESLGIRLCIKAFVRLFWESTNVTIFISAVYLKFLNT